MFEWITNLNDWISLCLLIILESILGIDNVIFLSIIVNKLPAEKQNKVRYLGLFIAMLVRLVLLSSFSWITHLINPIFIIKNYIFSIRNLILLFGGVFLIVQSIKEIYITLIEKKDTQNYQFRSIFTVILQIIFLDVVFSFDSIITAVGLSDHLLIMIIAVIVSVGIMMLTAKSLADFINSNPSVKILMLSFLFLIGFNLLLESVNYKIEKTCIYFSMLFSIAIEILNYIKNKKKY